MDEASFWEDLEYRVSREMEGIEDCRRRGMWCDGFIAQRSEQDLGEKRICGKAWIGMGPRNQEEWTFELLLPVPVASQDAVPWAELLPAEDVTQWLTIDHERRHLVVAPGDSVMMEDRSRRVPTRRTRT